MNSHGLTLDARFRGPSVRAKAFNLRKFLDGPERFAQRRLFIFYKTRPPLKLIDGQARKGRPAAAGRERVARPRDVISQHRRRIISKKYGPGCHE